MEGVKKDGRSKKEDPQYMQIELQQTIHESNHFLFHSQTFL